MQSPINFFADTLTVAVSDAARTLLTDPFFQARRNKRVFEFWKMLPESRFPLLKDFALNVQHVWHLLYL